MCPQHTCASCQSSCRRCNAQALPPRSLWTSVTGCRPTSLQPWQTTPTSRCVFVCLAGGDVCSLNCSLALARHSHACMQCVGSTTGVPSGCLCVHTHTHPTHTQPHAKLTHSVCVPAACPCLNRPRSLQVVSAKSSEVNLVLVAADPSAEDVVEHAVPEQFISTFKGGKLVTTAASHGGG